MRKQSKSLEDIGLLHLKNETDEAAQSAESSKTQKIRCNFFSGKLKRS